MTATWGGSVVLDRTPEEVWDFVMSEANDVNRRAPWVRAVRRLSEGPVGVGTRYQTSYRFFGRDEDVTVELTDVEAPRRVAWQQVGDGTLAVNFGRYDIEPADSGTRFTVTGTITSRGWRRLFDAPFASYLNRVGTPRQHSQLAAALAKRGSRNLA
jgi:carbon monoxide dehydrogenase subunit G